MIKIGIFKPTRKIEFLDPDKISARTSHEYAKRIIELGGSYISLAEIPQVEKGEKPQVWFAYRSDIIKNAVNKMGRRPLKVFLPSKPAPLVMFYENSCVVIAPIIGPSQ